MAAQFVDVGFDPSMGFTLTTTFPLDGTADGRHTIQFRATGADGLTLNTVETSFTLDTQPPTITIQQPAAGTTTSTNPTFVGHVTDNLSGVAVPHGDPRCSGTRDRARRRIGELHVHDPISPTDGTVDGSHTVSLQATDQAGNTSQPTKVSFTLDKNFVPDPSSVAPALSQTVATTMDAETSFLYTGANPIQKGVAAGTIDPASAAVVRGMVENPDGSPLADATITVEGHPEYGYTYSRSDGMFDLAVNGGGTLTIAYAKAGDIPVVRSINAPLRRLRLCSRRGPHPAGFQDQHGSIRRGGARAGGVRLGRHRRQRHAAVDCDRPGRDQCLAGHARRDDAARLDPEHPGDRGSRSGHSAPRPCPPSSPTSGYTYCVDLGADEETAAGASSVSFSKPVTLYLQNYRNLLVGTAIPVGYYNAALGQWQALDDGVIVKVLSVTDGVASLDVDGSGNAASAATLAKLGIDNAELQEVASLYQPGQELWRVPMPHFSIGDQDCPVISRKVATGYDRWYRQTHVFRARVPQK